ncbi:putative ubiE/COQ5 methyltransferase [Gamsiella multidivaricata]|uniref:putative ubiE/COQ5 methyltransferase n=1 Tax=Gamsiella multidivaricata TaxID=101098 RepID=UPI002220005D|nr:putative ubiE/COQ5 methyltransferase [Gamsiella multidivaricata]KAG0367893.1 hypothetical protein BGZ54_003062 [Gamsiella multidivaricata]KAI7818056.1 putative ubiE/COQ5 methyltransferase [Gamsiella multidivaricata]
MSSHPIVYSSDHTSAVLRTHGWRTAANSAAYLVPYLKPEMTILDVGCGPGSISVDIAKLVPHGRVIGVEYTAEPLEQARAFAAKEGVTNAEFRIGDIHALEFPDNTFDVVHAHQVLQHVADPVQALREMCRVTKPGGIVAARESATPTWYPESAGLKAYWDLQTRIAQLKGGNPHPGSHIHVWAQQAGFERSQITCSAGTWCYSTPEERAYWGGTMKERTLSSAFATIALDKGLATQEELKDMAQGWQKWIEDDDGWYAILHGEIICRK